MKGLRSAQREVMKYTSGKLGIAAVPGAGKTFILVHLIVKLIKDKRLEHKGEKILVLTYMNSAVVNFKERIRTSLTDGISRVEVMTIHKLTNQIIKENLREAGLGGENYTTLTGDNAYYLMGKAVNEEYQKAPQAFEVFLQEGKRQGIHHNRWQGELIRLSLYLVSLCKNYDIKLEKLFSLTKKYKKESLIKYLAQIARNYEKKCHSESYLDYDDLLNISYRLLKENPTIAKKYQEKYKYIFEDEAQDSNTLQSKILKLISRGNLVRVGDLNQSVIASFTHSDMKIFKDFLKANHKIEMFESSRSSKEIINLANYLVEDTRVNHPLEVGRQALTKQFIELAFEGETVQNPKPSNYGLKAETYENNYQELRGIVKFIKKFQKHYPEKKGAILLPRNYQINDLGELLKGEKIDYQTLGDISKHLLDTMNMLGDLTLFLARPHIGKNLINIVRTLYNKLEVEDKSPLEELEIYEILAKNYPEEVLDKLDQISKNIKDQKNKEVVKLIRKLKVTLEFPQNNLIKLLIFVSDIYNFDMKQRLLVDKIAGDLRRVFNLNPTWTLYELGRELKKPGTSEFTYLAKSVDEQTLGQVEQEHNLTITTYHKSKGLEWDYVWLASINADAFPTYVSDDTFGEVDYLKETFKYPKDYLQEEFFKEFLTKEYKNYTLKRKEERIAESVRLLYVGITRAKEYLVISSTSQKGQYYYKRLEKHIVDGKKEYEKEQGNG